MIRLNLHDNLHIQIETDDWDYLRAIKDNFSYYAHNYKFMPRYKSGLWDGKISLFNSANQTLPYGLLLDWMKYHKKEWGDIPYELSADVKQLYNGIKPNYKKDLLFTPYEYQEDCINACLKTSKGIIRSATASGKSIMISYTLRALWDSGEIENGIIIVPSIGLVTQFYTDMEDYGIDMSLVGRVGDDWKEWDKPLIISTWQSLQNVPEHMERMDVIFVDEVHGAKANVLTGLLKQAPRARFRFGFTGTMPSSLLDQNQVKSYLGPILKEYGSVELAKLGYVAKCKINMIYVNYNEKPKGTYNEIKDICFNNTFRLGLIKNIIKDTNGNILLLVGKVEDEGELLKNILKDDEELKNYEIEFLSGRDNSTDREKWRKYMDTTNNIVLIATYGTFQQGINIKSLSNLILASPFKSKVRVLQSIGRTLRLHADKKNGAVIWDICDRVKYLDKHADTRMKHYDMEGFEVIDHELQESNVNENTLLL